MNGTKMSKNFFFQMIEKRLNVLAEEVKEMKADKNLPSGQRNAKENILFGRLIELATINSTAINIDYGTYSKLDEKIRAVMDLI